MTRHPQVKLPGGRTCDEKILPLVGSLRKIPRVRTVTSCQEQRDDSGGWVWAYVCCDYNGPGNSLFALCRRIASALNRADITYEVTINWWFDGPPRFFVRVTPDGITLAADAINQMQLKNARSLK